MQGEVGDSCPLGHPAHLLYTPQVLQLAGVAQLLQELPPKEEARPDASLEKQAKAERMRFALP